MSEPVIPEHLNDRQQLIENVKACFSRCAELEAQLKVADSCIIQACTSSERDLIIANREQAATIGRLTEYLDYMAMGFVPPDRCKSYAAAVLKNPSEPK